MAGSCPGCQGTMERHEIAGGHPVHACRACGGAWAPKETVDAVVEAARARPLPPGQPPRRQVHAGGVGPVVYRRCPQCGKLMARRNFARISGVILDTCPDHGTYFDPGELPAIVDFVRSGGLELAQQREIDRLERERRRASMQAPAAGMSGMSGSVLSQPSSSRNLETTTALDAVAAFIGWVVWWDS